MLYHLFLSVLVLVSFFLPSIIYRARDNLVVATRAPKIPSRITFKRLREPVNGERSGRLAGLADQVMEYFVALIVGVILLYVLWQVVIDLASDIPPFFKWGVAIVIAAAGALLVLAKSGIER